MKITNMQLPRLVKAAALTIPLVCCPIKMEAQKFNDLKYDIFEKTENFPTPAMFTNMDLSPEVQVGNDTIFPAVVVDLSENRLYHYDFEGYLKEIYPIASGKASTPTKTGLKIITGIENYPYKTAPKSTKRYKNPNDYGPNVIILANVDTKTGEITGCDGQFLHGTNNPNSIGKKVSKGCIRVHNDVIKILSEQLYKEQYILIKD